MPSSECTSMYSVGWSDDACVYAKRGLTHMSTCVHVCHLGWRTLLKCNHTNHACLCACVHVCMCVLLCACVHVCMCACVHVCMCVLPWMDVSKDVKACQAHAFNRLHHEFVHRASQVHTNDNFLPFFHAAMCA